MKQKPLDQEVFDRLKRERDGLFRLALTLPGRTLRGFVSENTAKLRTVLTGREDREATLFAEVN